MVTFNRILCPTDLSPDSEKALLYAASLARAYNAKLLVCHCHVGGISSRSAMSDEGTCDCHKTFGGTAACCTSVLSPEEHFGREGGDGGVGGGITFSQEISAAIMREAADQAVDLIVILSRRRSREAALLGSTAEEICRTAPCPVLVTHQDSQAWLMEAGEISLARVLVAYDFSDDSELAFNYGLTLAQKHQAELHMLHVLPAPDASELWWMLPDTETAYRKALRRLLNAVPAQTRLRCEVKQVVRRGAPFREILSYAQENGIGLVCLGARGANFGVHSLFGSNVDRVLRQSPCPVLVARPLRPG